MTILGVLALGAAVSARAEERKGEAASKVDRAMAVAQIDFDLHRAGLGLVGSTLPSERRAAAVERAMAVAEIDFDLHRSQLGLVGSSFLSGRQPKPETTASLALVARTAPARSTMVAEVPAGINEPRQ
jgi:hypothetical protein